VGRSFSSSKNEGTSASFSILQNPHKAPNTEPVDSGHSVCIHSNPLNASKLYTECWSSVVITLQMNELQNLQVYSQNSSLSPCMFLGLLLEKRSMAPGCSASWLCVGTKNLCQCFQGVEYDLVNLNFYRYEDYSQFLSNTKC
jgi:hypothetical protein